MTQTLTQPKRRFFVRMFQMRFGVFMVVVAGCAAICWAYLFYQDNIDPELSIIHSRLSELRGSRDPNVRKLAAQSLDHIPPSQFSEGATVLMRAMRDPDAPVRVAAIQSLSMSLHFYFAATNGEIPAERDAATLGLIAAFQDSDKSVRTAASSALRHFNDQALLMNGKSAKLGLDPKIVTPALLKLLDDPQTRFLIEALPRVLEPEWKIPPTKILSAIKRIEGPGKQLDFSLFLLLSSPSGMDVLETILDDPELCATALIALDNQRLGHADKVVPLLVRRVATANPGDQLSLIFAIASYQVMPDEILPIVIKRLEEECAEGPVEREFGSRSSHRFTKGGTGNPLASAIALASPEAAKAALPLLLRAAASHKVASMAAVGAIVQIDPQSAEAKALVPLLANELIQDRSVEAKTWAANALALLGPVAADAAPALLDVAKRPDSDLRRRTTHSLTEIGPSQASFVVPALAKIAKKLLQSQAFPDDVLDAILTLAPASPEAAEVLMLLVEISETKDHDNEKEAKTYLKTLTVADNPTLRRESQSSDPKRKARAEILMKKIDGR